MAGSRGKKRTSRNVATDAGDQRGGKRLKTQSHVTPAKHALLGHYFPKVLTLREHLIVALPSSSRLRRKKIANLGSTSNTREGPVDDIETSLCRLLDTTLIGVDQARQPNEVDRWEKWTSFSQKGDDSHVTLHGDLPKSQALSLQAEIVDFAVWLLFSRKADGDARPKHLLCDGFRRNAAQAAPSAIPGLFSHFANRRVEALKEDPWPQLLMLLGKSGNKIMIDLLVDCAIFLPVEAGIGNLYQLSGMPVSELVPLADVELEKKVQGSGGSKSLQAPAEKLTSAISFVRSRMLYARPALNALGLVQFGLRHIHVLNRCPHLSSSGVSPTLTDAQVAKANDEATSKVMMYIFPRQFGLHNVFTSAVDSSKTTQKHQDYTLREEEIKHATKNTADSGVSSRLRIPKRLRGEPFRLVRRLQVLHGRCAYSELLRHYCPCSLDSTRCRKPTAPLPPLEAQVADHTTQVTTSGTQSATTGRNSKRKIHEQDRRKPESLAVARPLPSFESLTELATPASNVSAFCQAVLTKIIPNQFWGDDLQQSRNMSIIMAQVDHFVKLRKFESMSLHEVAVGLRVTDMKWLALPTLQNHKTSQTDMRKRVEILNEFLYYVFDSLLIPLIRSNFYVTESSAHRYKMFFFRHDVWRCMSEPAISMLKVNMFEEVKLDNALGILKSRNLGFSHVRLLPKETSMRPIMNLKKRSLMMGNRKVLGPSINSILSPIHSVLRLERDLDPTKLGSSLFSVADIHPRLKEFRARLPASPGKLYFAKLDVKSAFDTIPQNALVELMRTVTSETKYKLTKHAEVKAGHRGGVQQPTKRWQSLATRPNDRTSFLSRLENQLATAKRYTMFVDNAMQRQQDAQALLTLMASHIRQNLVKIGKKYYRQKEGIPQGSVLSLTLCNYFYADLEIRHLSFLSNDGDCLLLRLIDDFLLITPDKSKAQRFVRVMHEGFPEYGVTVHSAKTLVNFNLSIKGDAVAKLPKSQRFPYCGTLIDCETLEVAKNRDHLKDPVTSNGLTVEYGRMPGRNFSRKVLNAFKIQSHIMFYDTNHNSSGTVFRNLFDAFSETITKMWAYARCLPAKHRPAPRIVIDTVIKLADVAYLLLTSKIRRLKHPGYRCAVSKAQVTWLALNAVKVTLGRKQSSYREVSEWLSREISSLSSKKGIRDSKLMQRTVIL